MKARKHVSSDVNPRTAQQEAKRSRNVHFLEQDAEHDWTNLDIEVDLTGVVFLRPVECSDGCFGGIELR